MMSLKERDELQKFMINKGIDAKVLPNSHAFAACCRKLGYKVGDFPIQKNLKAISFPVHEFISDEDINFIIKK